MLQRPLGLTRKIVQMNSLHFCALFRRVPRACQMARKEGEDWAAVHSALSATNDIMAQLASCHVSGGVYCVRGLSLHHPRRFCALLMNRMHFYSLQGENEREWNLLRLSRPCMCPMLLTVRNLMLRKQTQVYWQSDWGRKHKCTVRELMEWWRKALNT